MSEFPLIFIPPISFGETQVASKDQSVKSYVMSRYRNEKCPDGSTILKSQLEIRFLIDFFTFVL